MKLVFAPKKQLGLSLIELMISMFIGLFLLGGITSTYVHSKKSSIHRDQLSLLEDNGRMALEILSKTIQHTGYTSNTGAPLDSKFLTGTVVSNGCTTGSNVLSTSIFPSNATLDNNDGDSIGIINLGDDSVFTDCSGEVLPVACQVKSGISTGANETDAARIYNAFYLKNTTTGKSLMCAGSRNTSEIIIADGIENMQILYGINVDGSEDRSVERYANASDVGGLWNNITSVKIALLLRSEKKVKDMPESQTYSLLDTPITSPNDRFHRSVFSTTISLRN